MVDRSEIRELLTILSESGWDNASIVTPDFTLTLGNPGSGAVPISAGPAPTAVTATSAPVAVAPQVPMVTPDVAAATPASAAPMNGAVITAPSIGVVWRAPKPGAPPFVEIGQLVAPDDVVFLVEVMKLFTSVQAGVAGRVSAFHVENGAMAEYGTPVLTVVPE